MLSFSTSNSYDITAQRLKVIDLTVTFDPPITSMDDNKEFFES